MFLCTATTNCLFISLLMPIAFIYIELLQLSSINELCDNIYEQLNFNLNHKTQIVSNRVGLLC